MEIVFNRPVSAGGCEIDEVYTISSKNPSNMKRILLHILNRLTFHAEAVIIVDTSKFKL